MNKIPIFTMLCGLPGSGKSTYAKELYDNPYTIIISSDGIRRELYGNENVNGKDENNKVFRLLHKRVKESLLAGYNVVYDATNIRSKRRMHFLKHELRDIPCKKVCVIMAVPYYDCCYNNSQRERNVPVNVIEKMYKNWDTPYWYEGWDDIVIKYSGSDEIRHSQELDPFTFVKLNLDYNQYNKHHTLTLGNHCLKVAQEFENDSQLLFLLDSYMIAGNHL